MATQRRSSMIINGVSWPQMDSELCRLATFRHYPADAAVYPSSLARSGFVYIGDGTSDTVICFYCRTEKSNWRIGQDIEEAHRASCERPLGSEDVRNDTPVLQRPVETRDRSLRTLQDRTFYGDVSPERISTTNERFALESESNSTSLDAELAILRDKLFRNGERFMGLMRRDTSARSTEVGGRSDPEIYVNTLDQTPRGDSIIDHPSVDTSGVSIRFGAHRESLTFDTNEETPHFDSERGITVLGINMAPSPTNERTYVVVAFEGDTPVGTVIEGTPVLSGGNALLADTKPVVTKLADTSFGYTSTAETLPADTSPAETLPVDTSPAEALHVDTSPAEALPVNITPDGNPPADINEKIAASGTISPATKQFAVSCGELSTIPENYDSVSFNGDPPRCTNKVEEMCSHHESESRDLAPRDASSRLIAENDARAGAINSPSPQQSPTEPNTRATTRRPRANRERLSAERPKSCFSRFSDGQEECPPAEQTTREIDGVLSQSSGLKLRFCRSISYSSTEDVLK